MASEKGGEWWQLMGRISSSRSSPFLWAWLLALYLAFFFLAFPLAAQPPIEPMPDFWPNDSLPLQPILTGSVERTENLLERLNERKVQIESLKVALQQLAQQANASEANYAELSEQLRQAEESRMNLEKELTAISDSRARLQEEYVALSFSFAGYKSEAMTQIADLKRIRNTWRVIGIIGGTLGLTGILYGLLK